MTKHFALLSMLGTCLVVVTSPAKGDVTWEEQAERLQLVNASFLDNAPVLDSYKAALSIEGTTVISFLPKADPTVGAKDEETPSPPVHSVPMLRWTHHLGASPDHGFAYRLWAGYLPAGVEKLIGVDAKLTQLSYGVAPSYRFSFGNHRLTLPLIYQQSNSELAGAITAKDSEDEFTAATQLIGFSPTFEILTLSTWFSYMVASKSTTSEFTIPADSTKFDLSDNRIMHQLALGYGTDMGIKAGLAQVFVPERVLMPRLFVAYEVAL